MWPGVLVAGVLYVSATSPWIAQRLPRFLLPVLAAAGAVLIVRALVRSLLRLAHAQPTERGLRLVPVLVNAAATLLLVISPAIRLLDVTVAASDGRPRTLAGFGDWRGGEGYPRRLAAFSVGVGQRVRRGQRVGAVGTTGQRAWPGDEHVHLELQRGANPKDLEDPRPRFAGCFDDVRTYPAERLLLTYPVRC